MSTTKTATARMMIRRRPTRSRRHRRGYGPAGSRRAWHPYSNCRGCYRRRGDNHQSRDSSARPAVVPVDLAVLCCLLQRRTGSPCRLSAVLKCVWAADVWSGHHASRRATAADVIIRGINGRFRSGHQRIKSRRAASTCIVDLAAGVALPVDLAFHRCFKIFDRIELGSGRYDPQPAQEPRYCAAERNLFCAWLQTLWLHLI